MRSNGGEELTKPTSVSGGGGGRERRRIQRQPGDTILATDLEVEGQVIHSTVKDISVQGIGLFVDAPLDPGTPLTLNSKSSPGVSVEAMVMHKHPFGDKWLLGCAFLRFLRVEDMLALGGTSST